MTSWKPVLILLGLSLSSQLFSQVQFSDTDKPNFQPPSPEASSLGRFGQYEVNMNTGVPGISIPIYTIQLPNFSFPISISYSATGVKVSEVGSRLGIGWALEAGGTISRSVIGANDSQYGRLIPPTSFSPIWPNVTLPPSNDYDLAKTLLDNPFNPTHDTEPDLLYYNFLGFSGKFIDDENGWVPLPFTNDLNYDGEFHDTKGNRFQFGYGEMISTHTTCLSTASDPAINQESASYLSKVITANGDTVSLSYEQESYSYFQSYSQKKYFRNNSTMECPLPEDGNCLTVATTTVPRIKQIVASNGIIIDFVYDSIRRDVEVISGSAKLLNKIIIRHKNSSEQFIHSFEYEYTISSPAQFTYGSSRASDRKRLYLKKYVDRTGGAYSFEYRDREYLPARNSFSIDHWGYYNGASNTGLIPSYSPAEYNGANRSISDLNLLCGSLVSITYPTGGKTVFEFEAHKADSVGYLGGGLRVKSISNYSNGSITDKKIYTYYGPKVGLSENQLGYKYVDQSMTRKRKANDPPCVLVTFCDYWILSSTTVPVCGGFDFNNSVYYGKVDVKQVSGSTVLGKSVYYYSSLYYDTGGPTLKLEGLDRTYPVKEEHFKSDAASNYYRISKKELFYTVKNDASAVYQPTGNVPNYKQVLGFKIKYQLPEEESDCASSIWILPATFLFEYYKYISAWHFNNSIIETTYNDNDSLKTYQFFRYDRPVHAQLTSNITVDSKGDTLKTITRYPEDYASGGISGLPSSSQFYYRGIPIESYSLNKNNYLLSAQLNEMSKVGNAIRLNRKHSTNLSTALNSPLYPAVNNSTVSSYFPSGHQYEQRYEVTLYDSRNNPQEIVSNGNVIQSYIWDPATHNLLAAADNASFSEIAFTNFDITSQGGWTYNTALTTSADKFSGTYSFTGSTVTRNVTPGIYKIAFHTKDGTPSITGSGIVATETTSTTVGLNGWNFHEWTISVSASSTVSINNATGAKLDDLQIHPFRSMMSIFSYHPLLGLVSKSDVNNVTQYFEYDGSGRLKLIRDDDGNILKTFEYHYVSDPQQ